jgi:hypothetical protein
VQRWPRWRYQLRKIARQNKELGQNRDSIKSDFALIRAQPPTGFFASGAFCAETVTGFARLALIQRGMLRGLVYILLAALAAVLPVWRFNRDWSYGPAMAIAFLLMVNLLAPVCDYLGRWRERHFR